MSNQNTQHWDGEYEFGSPWRDDEAGEDADFDADDGAVDDAAGDTDVVPCPNCGCDVYEEADVCPVCGEFMLDDRSESASRPAGRKFIILLLIIGLLLATLGWMSW